MKKIKQLLQWDPTQKEKEKTIESKPIVRKKKISLSKYKIPFQGSGPSVPVPQQNLYPPTTPKQKEKKIIIQPEIKQEIKPEIKPEKPLKSHPQKQTYQQPPQINVKKSNNNKIKVLECKNSQQNIQYKLPPHRVFAKPQKKQPKKPQITDPIQITIIGGEGSGKSCLVQCYNDQSCPSSSSKTSQEIKQMTFVTQLSNKKKVNINVTVYKGESDPVKYVQNVIRKYKQNQKPKPHICLICLSLQVKEDIDKNNQSQWKLKFVEQLKYAYQLKKIVQNSQMNTQIMFVGTHSDCQNIEQVLNIINQTSKKQFLNLMTCSSRDNINVKQVFNKAIKKGYRSLLKRIQPNHFNYVLVGDQSVGKSCLILSYTDNNCQSKYQTKQIVQKTQYKPNPKQEKYQNQSKYTKTFYDVPSRLTIQETIKYIQQNLYENVDSILVCYSLTSKKSFQNSLTRYFQLLKKYKRIPIVLVGNKLDLYQIHVSRIQERIKNLCQEHNLVFSFKEGLKKKPPYQIINQFKILCKQKDIPLQIINKQSLPNEQEEKIQKLEIKNSKKPLLHLYEIVDLNQIKKFCRSKKIILKNCSAFQGINLQNIFSHIANQGNQAQQLPIKPNIPQIQ